MARVLAAIGLHELVHEVRGRGNHHLELQRAPAATLENTGEMERLQGKKVGKNEEIMGFCQNRSRDIQSSGFFLEVFRGSSDLWIDFGAVFG